MGNPAPTLAKKGTKIAILKQFFAWRFSQGGRDSDTLTGDHDLDLDDEAERRYQHMYRYLATCSLAFPSRFSDEILFISDVI